MDCVYGAEFPLKVLSDFTLDCQEIIKYIKKEYDLNLFIDNNIVGIILDINENNGKTLLFNKHLDKIIEQNKNNINILFDKIIPLFLESWTKTIEKKTKQLKKEGLNEIEIETLLSEEDLSIPENIVFEWYVTFS